MAGSAERNQGLSPITFVQQVESLVKRDPKIFREVQKVDDPEAPHDLVYGVTVFVGKKEGIVFVRFIPARYSEWEEDMVEIDIPMLQYVEDRQLGKVFVTADTNQVATAWWKWSSKRGLKSVFFDITPGLIGIGIGPLGEEDWRERLLADHIKDLLREAVIAKEFFEKVEIKPVK